MAGKSLVIIGAHGHAKSVAEAALSAGFEVRNFVDEVNEVPPNSSLLGIPVMSSVSDLDVAHEWHFAIAVGSNPERSAVFTRLSRQIREDRFPPIIHATASISRFAEIGPGSQVLQNASVGASATVGRFALINTNACLDHDSYLDEFASLNPGAVVAGRARIGERSTIGMNAAVAEGVSVGTDTTIGANSFVRNHIPSGALAVGNPAKVVHSNATYAKGH